MTFEKNPNMLLKQTAEQSFTSAALSTSVFEKYCTNFYRIFGKVS